MFAVLKGNQPGNGWNNPAVWANGRVPVSSDKLNILLDASSVDNLGTAQTPFVANDVIGASAGISYPGLFVTGFLHADDLANLSDLQIPSSGGVIVSHDLINVQTVEVHDGGFLDVGRDLLNVGRFSISFGSTIEVGHIIGRTDISFGIGGGTLILDHPQRNLLNNSFALGAGGNIVNIELGHTVFDAADFIPSVPGGLNGKIDLMDHGRLVYQLNHVSESTPAGILTVGMDKTTGYDFVSYHA